MSKGFPLILNFNSGRSPFHDSEERAINSYNHRDIFKREVIMSIKIVIERKFKEAVVPEMLQIIDEIRIKALRDRGYIGGETVVNVDDDREVLVFSAWSSVDDWDTWYNKKDWEELEKKLAPHLEEAVKIRAFMPGSDYTKKAYP
jgi:heme-degrading monooxygenase HmoA